MIAQSRGADVMFHEALSSDIVDYHTGSEEAAQAVGDAKAVYEGKINVSRDGIMVGLPSGSDAVIYESRL